VLLSEVLLLHLLASVLAQIITLCCCIFNALSVFYLLTCLQEDLVLEQPVLPLEQDLGLGLPGKCAPKM